MRSCNSSGVSIGTLRAREGSLMEHVDGEVEGVASDNGDDSSFEGDDELRARQSKQERAPLVGVSVALDKSDGGFRGVASGSWFTGNNDAGAFKLNVAIFSSSSKESARTGEAPRVSILMPTSSISINFLFLELPQVLPWRPSFRDGIAFSPEVFFLGMCWVSTCDLEILPKPWMLC